LSIPLRFSRQTLAWPPVLLVLLLSGLLAAERLRLSEHLLKVAEQRYGEPARERLLEWESLINSDEAASELDKLQRINAFFNRIPQIDDIEHWKKQNYWATPVELLASDGGDCEDYALAKYFSLRRLNIPDEKLQVTYVKAYIPQSGGIRSHMVLSYYPSPDADPLILDNLIGEIRPASRRKDLTPVYGFNGTGLWLARERGQGRHAESIDELGLWSELMERMEREQGGSDPSRPRPGVRW
jgi:predicted transglutaminase-like cysteine proteinase